jgi:hypothetical protein
MGKISSDTSAVTLASSFTELQGAGEMVLRFRRIRIIHLENTANVFS